ncbi:MAG: YebC/PmpR family DNA-binding transcriptional regulator [Actinomycetota bacterium]
MAGHSKWAGIKHKKAVVDARRGKLFAKLIRGIEVAAREGGSSNPINNMTLAAAVDRAKASRVPADTIERAAKRGAGELGENVNYERVTYEGYAPGGVAVLVETLTDNRNRTGGDVRTALTRAGGNLGEPGSVAWMFDRRGSIIVKGASEDDILEAAAEAGADDIRPGDDGSVEVITDVQNFGATRDAIASAGFEIELAELTMIPQTTVELDATGARPFLKLFDVLDEHDDVQAVYMNFDVPDEVLSEVV